MDRSLVLVLRLVSTSRTFDEIAWNSSTFFSTVIYEGHWLSVGRMLEIQQQVRTHAINPFKRYRIAGNIVILENDSSNMNGVGVEFGAG